MSAATVTPRGRTRPSTPFASTRRPLTRFSRGSKIQQRGGDWYGAVNEERRPACLTVQLSFRDARRLRGLNNLKGASW
jgi:hypothetical protein